MEVEPTPASVMVLVNFGIVAGRSPSRIEIETLWEALRRHVPGVIISVEQRYEFQESAAEICLDQVRIEVPDGTLPQEQLSGLAQNVFDAARGWASECITSLEGTMTLAERLARQAVVDA
ncbi:MAG: hypothetical protein ABIO51_01750 [Solirubrobacteraceae bacterium]